MANVLNRAEKITLEQKKECSLGKEWVTTGFQLSGQVNKFVCENCYKSKYRRKYPESGREVNIDNVPTTPYEGRIRKLFKPAILKDARIGIATAMVVAIVVIFIVITNVFKKDTVINPPEPAIKMVATPVFPAPNTEKSEEEKLAARGSESQPINLVTPKRERKKSRVARIYNENEQQPKISDDPIKKLTEEIRNNPNDASLYNNRGCEHAYKCDDYGHICDYKVCICDYKKAADDFRVACEKGLEIGCENLRTALNTVNKQ